MPSSVLEKLDLQIPTPRYQQVASQLRRQIHQGKLKPGERVPSFPEMKARHGVSQATLERAHAILAHEGLIERRRGLGTFVTLPVSGKATGVIGVLAGDASQEHPYYLHLLKSVRQTARRENIELLLLHENSTVRWEKVDGVLQMAPYSNAIHLPFGMPCVSLLFSTPGVLSVVADDAGGVRAAVEHLLELGHKKIAFMTQALAPGADELSLHRLAAYKQTLREARVKTDARWVRVVTDHWREDSNISNILEIAREKMAQWLRADWSTLGCTAILAQNDQAAVGIIEALQHAKIRVPRDVSVIGFDGTQECALYRPRLTTIEVPLQKIGAQGFELLRERIDSAASAPKRKIPAPHILPTTLRVRDSSAPPGVAPRQ